MSRLDNRDFAAAADKGNEGRRCLRTQLLHREQGFDKNLADFRAAQITSRREHKGPDVGSAKGVNFNRAIANMLVFRQHDPAAFAHIPKPYLISRVLRKMLVVDADFFARFAERSWNDLAFGGNYRLGSVGGVRGSVGGVFGFFLGP